MSGLDDQLRKMEREELSAEDKALDEYATQLFAEGKIDEAIPLFERLIAVTPYCEGSREAGMRYLLADCYVQKGQPARALQQLEFAMHCYDGFPRDAFYDSLVREKNALIIAHPDLRPKNL